MHVRTGLFECFLIFQFWAEIVQIRFVIFPNNP